MKKGHPTGNRQKGKDCKSQRTGVGSKNQRRDEEIVDTALRQENDPAWYSAVPQLVKDSASYPFAYPVGMPITLPKVTTGVLGATQEVVVPGILSINILPVYGQSGNQASPLNVASTNIYSFVRHVNSGHANYDPADLMMYILAVDSLYMMHAFMCKIYGVARLYTPTNRYYPRGLLESMGVDADDVLSNLAQLRYACNLAATKLLSYRIPSKLSLLKRHQWLMLNLFTDSDTSKAQTYNFNPSALWQYINTGSTGTQLQLVDIVGGPLSSGNLLTVTELVDLFDVLYEKVALDEDFGIMSGDILKAFGDGLVNAPYISEEFITLPVYSKEVLSQIENAIAMGSPMISGTEVSGGTACTITQDPGVNGGTLNVDLIMYLQNDNTSIFAPILVSPAIAHLVNMHHDGVTPDDMMVATRLSGFGNVGWNTTDQATTVKPVTFATEIVCNFVTTLLDSKGTYSNYGLETNDLGYVPGRTSSGALSLESFTARCQFDWSPVYWLFKNNETVIGSTMDLDNFTVVNQNDLSQMHDVAVLSELDYR